MTNQSDQAPITLSEDELEAVNGAGDATKTNAPAVSISMADYWPAKLAAEKSNKFLDTMTEGETCGV